MVEELERPNQRWPHVYVVLRIDDNLADADVLHQVSAVATFREHAAAEADASRLNALVVDSASRYVVLTSRLKG